MPLANDTLSKFRHVLGVDFARSPCSYFQIRLRSVAHRSCLTDSLLSLRDNYLTGTAPSVLTLDQASWFDRNCFSNTTYLRRQRTCAPTEPSAIQALVDLYNGTRGDDWTRHENWWIGDPCNNSWHGVDCEQPVGSSWSVIT